MFSSVVNGDKDAVFINVWGDTFYIDVKGEFAGRTNSTQYTFPIKQKWMYDKYQIYVNKIVPSKLFKQTFEPAKLLSYPRTSSGKYIISEPNLLNGKKLYYKPL